MKLIFNNAHEYFILDSSVVIKKEEAVSPDGAPENVCPELQNDDGMF